MYVVPSHRVSLVRGQSSQGQCCPGMPSVVLPVPKCPPGPMCPGMSRDVLGCPKPPGMSWDVPWPPQVPGLLSPICPRMSWDVPGCPMAWWGPPGPRLIESHLSQDVLGCPGMSHGLVGAPRSQAY